MLSKNTQMSNFTETLQQESGQTEGRTVRHDKAYCLFSKFCKRA